MLSALFVHCFAHCTNLCLWAVGRACVPVRNVFDLVKELSRLIRYSPKRSTLFANLQQEFCPDVTSLKPLCPTRWTVPTAAISSVLCKYYQVLCEDLEQKNANTHDDYCRKAARFLAQMEKFGTFFELKLSLGYSGSEQLSLTLLGKNATFPEATVAAELAILYLGRLRSDKTLTSSTPR